jgi:hypothetical protein
MPTRSAKSGRYVTAKKAKRHTLQRLDSFIEGVAGKRLTYKGLIQ